MAAAAAIVIGALVSVVPFAAGLATLDVIMSENLLENSTNLGDHLLEGLRKLQANEPDAEWGRLYDERPHFDQPGIPPSPDDPYTLQSVRTTLTQLAATLTTP